MPSSHSAGVMGLSTSVGLISGFSSVIFAVALGFSLVTMYDAAGVRRAAGKTAACLNRMMDDFYNHDVRAAGGKLKELLGHTPLQVFVGAREFRGLADQEHRTTQTDHLQCGLGSGPPSERLLRQRKQISEDLNAQGHRR